MKKLGTKVVYVMETVSMVLEDCQGGGYNMQIDCYEDKLINYSPGEARKACPEEGTYAGD